MMNNDCRRRLLGIELKFFRQLNIDARRIEQFEKLGLVLEVRTGGITEAEARSLIALTKQLIKIFRVVIGNIELLTDPLVPQLSQRFGAFDTQAMKIKIVRVVIALEKLLRIFAGAAAHGHQMKRDDVHAS